GGVPAGRGGAGGGGADWVAGAREVRGSLPLYRSSSCDVWLLAWERGQDTDWHDHGGSSGSFAVAEGCLAEQYRAPGGRRVARRRGLGGGAGGVRPPPAPDGRDHGGRARPNPPRHPPPLLALTPSTPTPFRVGPPDTPA